MYLNVFLINQVSISRHEMKKLQDQNDEQMEINTNMAARMAENEAKMAAMVDLEIKMKENENKMAAIMEENAKMAAKMADKWKKWPYLLYKS